MLRTPPPPRALLLAALLLAGAPATGCRTLHAADSEIADGVHLVPGAFTAGSQPDGNSVVLVAPGGLVVVDTGRHAGHTDAVLDLARRLGRPVVAVVNTHWHLDHVGGNPRIRAAFPDARVHASPAIDGAMTGFLARYREYLEGALAEPADGPEAEAARAPLRAELALLDAGPGLAPDVRITASGERSFGGRTLRVTLETHAVTAGDLWLLDPATRTLIAGDLVTLPAPFFDTACPERWRESLDRLAEADFERLVPGHGPPMDRAAFETYRKAFGALVACAASREEGGKRCVEGWIEDAGALIAEGDEELARILLGYYLDGSLLAPSATPEKRAELCGG